MAKPTQDNNININAFRKSILDWYDRHQRVLPWRVKSGEVSNPYLVWLSEIMLQQTTVPTVGPYFEKFTKKWPTVHDLAQASQDDVLHEWAGLGYYARARNLHKCAQIVSQDLNGVFPQKQNQLEKLPGIGGYTSAAICAIAFNKPANVVDGNIERIISRIFAVEIPMPDAKPILKQKAGLLSDKKTDRPGDYAQALMDIGSSICIPKTPKCMLCPVIKFCEARKLGIESELPKKKPKKPKPQKHGIVYWFENEKGEIALERRGDKEMLGGMLGLPTSEWVSTEKPLDKIDENNFISHSFTHFDLKLYVHKKQKADSDYIWISKDKLDRTGLPTLFKKVVKIMT